MIKGVLASKSAKLIATCVCPVAGTVGVTVAVPPVRNAVHRATAPRAYALPKTRTRQAARPAVASAPPIQTAALSIPPCEPVLVGGPLVASLGETPLTPIGGVGGVPGGSGGVGPGGVLGGGGGVIGGGGGGVVTPGNPGTPVVPVIPGNPDLPGFPPIPEPATWLHMIVGFGVIGGVARLSLRGRGSADEEPEPAA